jgi:hypothetical protein
VSANTNYQSQITIDNNTGDVFLEAFLIDATHLNDKGWKVSYDDPVSFDDTVKRSLGHPLVLYEKILPKTGQKVWTHPVSETGDVYDDIEFQKPYIIGKSVHNKKVRDGLWHSTYKIIHEGAKRFLKGVKENSVGLFTSPHIVRPVLEDRQNIKTWGVIHNAIVSLPANGKQLAKVASICEGDAAGACSSLFASMDTSETKCGYCLGDSLKEYVTSQFLKTESSNSMSESSQGQSTANTDNNGQTGASNSNPNITNDGGNNQQQLLQQQQQQHAGQGQGQGNDAESSQKTIAALEEKIKQLESQNNSQNSNADAITKAEKRIGDLEKELALNKRTGSIEKLLTQAIGLYTDDNSGVVDEKKYNADLKKLVESNHNLEEIQELIQAQFVLNQHAKGKLTGNKASSDSVDEDQKFSSQVTESASMPMYTEMNAKGEHSSVSGNKQSQNYVNVLNHINNERLSFRSRFSKIGGSY